MNKLQLLVAMVVCLIHRQSGVGANQPPLLCAECSNMVIAPNIIPQRCFSVSPFKNCSMQCAANLFFDFKVNTVTIVRTCMDERHGSGEKKNTIFLFNLYNSSLSNCGTPQELFPKSIIEKFSANKREKYEKFIQSWTSSVCDNDVEVKDLDEVEGQNSLTYTTTSAESLRQD